MFTWCNECLGFNPGPQKVVPLHQPLKSVHKNLKLRRSVLSNIHPSDDSECSDDDKESTSDFQQEEDEYVLRKGRPYLEHPMAVPATRIIQIQPDGERIHRPDLEPSEFISSQPRSLTEDSMDAESISSSQQGSICSSSRLSNASSNLLRSTRASVDGSIHTIDSSSSLLSESNAARRFSVTSSQYDALRANYENPLLSDLADSSGRKRPFITLEYSRRRPMKFISPEEAAKVPPQPLPPSVFSFSASTKVKPYTDKTDSQWLGKSLPIFSGGDDVKYAGEYTTEGCKTPVKIRSATTLRAISVYETRIDTKNNPVWYSFGSLVLALRYLADAKKLEVDIVQVTELPPGKEKATVDFQVHLEPGNRHGWVKGIEPGPRHDVDTFTAKATIKVRKLTNRSFVASAWVNSKKHWPHLALGHGFVPNLGFQDLSSGEWKTFPLHLRQGSEIQDHLGMALVALSCCERILGYYTFTVDVLHVKNVKVQRFGEGAVLSPKATVDLWVKAYQFTEGQQHKVDMSGTSLIRPAGYDEAQGWEAIYKKGCTASFDVPKEKVHLATIILQIHGRARQRLSTKEALFGKVKLGPEDLFSGDTSKAPRPTMTPLTSNNDLENNEAMKSVPNDPLDPKLTHWGQSLRRKAKVEMWHRLQI